MPHATEALTLTADPQQVSVARLAVRRACSDAGTTAEMCDAAVLLTSETVTNAIIHGGTSVMLTVSARQDGVRVEVSDGNRSQPLLQRADLDSLGGRGLGIVTATAARWGVSDLQIGKTVWFELAHATEGPIQP